MRLMRLSPVLFVAALTCSPLHAAPLEAYGKLPTIEQAAISPSGGLIALVITNGEERMLVLQDFASQKLTYRVKTGDAKVRAVKWAGDGHLLVVTTVTANPMDVMTTQREWTMGFSLNVKTKRVSPLLRDTDNALNTIYGIPVVRMYRNEPMVFVQGVKFVNNVGRLSLFRIDLDNTTSKLVQTGESDTRDWLVGPDGEPAAQEIYDARSGRWSIKLKAKSGWREAITVTALQDPPSMIGLARDGQAVLYAGFDENDRPIWSELRLDEAPAAPAIPVSVGQGPIHDPQDGRLIGRYALIGDEGAYRFFDPEDDKIWQAVVAAFPGSLVDLESWSADHRKIVVKVDSPEDGPAYAVVDLATRKATWLGAEYIDVKEPDVSPQTPIQFKARDGMALSGYLTTPKGKTAKSLPLIVFPHGGPAARDVPGFDWWAQAIASRGYAVLQVNFRGSDGFGLALLEAGYGEWGRKMQTDLSDGVKYLADQGTIDPARVCIVGASYGGYAAVAGAAFDPGVYRCAASVAGLTDLQKFVAWSRGRRSVDAFRYWTRFMGAEGGRDQVLTDISPAANIDKVTIPILLVHGKDDSVVPIEQSRIMADALQKAGKPVEFVVLKGEDHWLSRGDTRLEMLTATMAFVEKYNPPN